MGILNAASGIHPAVESRITRAVTAIVRLPARWQTEASPSPHEAEAPHANQKSPAVRLFTPAIVRSLSASK